MRTILMMLASGSLVVAIASKGSEGLRGLITPVCSAVAVVATVAAAKYEGGAK